MDEGLQELPSVVISNSVYFPPAGQSYAVFTQDRLREIFSSILESLKSLTDHLLVFQFSYSAPG